MMYLAGVYKISNVETGQFYIGSSKDVPGRWAVHKNLMKKKKGVPALQRAHDRYGPWSLKYEVLFWCDEELLTLYEQRAFDVLQPEYNIQMIAGTGGMKGRQHREDSKRKISESMKRKRKSPSAFLDSADECPLSAIP